jgi:hypothetical protein
VEFDVEAVDVRGADPDGIKHGAIGEGAIVQNKAEIGLWKSREAIRQHGLGADTISSAGWAMNISVPCRWSFRPTSVLAVPTQLAM